MIPQEDEPEMMPMYREPSSHYTAGTSLVAGALLWWIGAFGFMPMLSDAYNSPDIVRQLAVIATYRLPWVAQNVLFLAGTALVAYGIAQISGMLEACEGERLGRFGRRLAYAATGLWWGIFWYLITVPTRGIRGEQDVPALFLDVNGPLWVIASLGMLISFASITIALVRGGMPKSLGAAVVTATVLLGAMVVVDGGRVPPLLFFSVPFLLGVILLVRSRIRTLARRNSWGWREFDQVVDMRR